MSYATLITNAGLAALAAAQAGGTAVTISHIAYGDGNGSIIVPDPAQIALTHEVHRRAINGISTDAVHPEWVVIESTIPPDIGGFTVREVGVILSDGTLFAVASYPEVYKPTVLESAGRDLYVKMILSVGNASNVTIEVDGSFVTATIDYVDGKPHNTFMGRDALEAHPSSSITHNLVTVEEELDAINIELDALNTAVSSINYINNQTYFIGGF